MEVDDAEPFDFGPLADANISRYTAAFVYTDNGAPKLAGSGTLVKCGKVAGILTAGHVLEYISGQVEIGICIFPVRKDALQKAKVPVKGLIDESVVFYSKTIPGEGPDLAFVRLPDDLMSSLAASASVVDLVFQGTKAGKERPEGAAPEGAAAIEAIAGAISELTPDPEVRGTRAVLSIEGLLNIGQIGPVGDNTQGFDLLSFRPKPENGFKLPESYRGTSGGGLWRIYVERSEDETYSVIDRRFVGVAFQQFGEKIQCHGVSSLYQRLVPAIHERWP